MHHPASSGLGFLPSVFPSPHMGSSDMGGPKNPSNDPDHPLTISTNWERRCPRKHRRRADDEACSAKRRRTMEEVPCDPAEYSSPKPDHQWSQRAAASPTLMLPSPTPPPAALRRPLICAPFSSSPASLTRPTESEGCCMEMESAQRKLQEIEDRITLEDDDEEEDLDIEPAQRRPVLVLSDSLREGLQRGIEDILPHTVTESMSHSCMELVVWRPPEDALTRRLKDSLQRQRKQNATCRQTPTPVPSSASSPTEVDVKGVDEEAFTPVYCIPGLHSCGEEDMEL
ncbi:coiled-coil domain-containing protein 117 [Denticeps clupeoides]|uniref:Coiled-coil domain-containing protein 117 n=1 Tax=Denticeps clupeoides TaxID=299321 RepID=A0AAY4BUD8_9TELE|nr:coiled-coil domain-containing protein 117 [Denticeps clupeoides]XP_028852412.1 coiled-coil domain-containing protein 117 [Denticeps clupeoides]XP_028852413.1 coiled-coil domain-containing protein 117 [Denticeps clupeoides]